MDILGIRRTLLCNQTILLLFDVSPFLLDRMMTTSPKIILYSSFLASTYRRSWGLFSAPIAPDRFHRKIPFYQSLSVDQAFPCCGLQQLKETW
jgi:hypothetical protein